MGGWPWRKLRSNKRHKTKTKVTKPKQKLQNQNKCYKANEQNTQSKKKIKFTKERGKYEMLFKKKKNESIIIFFFFRKKK